jgi:hypothetical protein
MVSLKPPLGRRLLASSTSQFMVIFKPTLRELPISRRHQLQLLANLGNVLGTIEPKARF